MTKKKEKTGKASKKEKMPEKSEKIEVQESSSWLPLDIMQSLDEEFDEFRRNIERWLRKRRSRIRSTMLTWPEYYWPKLEWAGIRQPLMDIKDTGKELVIEAEMPGIPKENIEIQLTEKSIEICGGVKSEETEGNGYHRRERSYSTCYRRVPLPADVIPTKADATLEHGILHIKLLKKKPATKEKVHAVKIK